MTARLQTNEPLPTPSDAAVETLELPASELTDATSARAGASRLGPAALRKWFALYLLWLMALTGGALLAFDAYTHGSGWALALWAICLGTFYISLANTLFPVPTMWMVMLLASDFVALPAAPWVRVLVVATATAIATGMANLNEYHVLHWAMGSRTAGKVTGTRMVQWAIRWFRVSPFWLLTIASLLPIPIDAVRWVAIADVYSRWRYFWAYVLGRWVRYAILAGATIWTHAGFKTIFAAQAALLVLAAVPVIWKFIRRARPGAA